MNQAVNIVIADRLSEAVLRRLMGIASGRPIIRTVYPVQRAWVPLSGPNGYGVIRKNVPAYNAASAILPHVILVDLDNNVCAPALVSRWLNDLNVSQNLVFRIAVREVESWLLADSDGLSDWLHLNKNWFPSDPERIKDPKRYIVRHAIRSRLSDIRTSIAPPNSSKGKTGPLYGQSMAAFARDIWDVEAASLRCESLRRARIALDRL